MVSRARPDTIALSVADGSTMRAYAARPPRARRRSPGLLLFQEAFGANAHIRDVARRLARAGYVTVAPELFHRTAPGFEGNYADFSSVRPHTQALTVAGLEADIRATHTWLAANARTDPARIAAIGFCIGTPRVILAASAVPLRAAVSFYGGIVPARLDRAPQVRSPLPFSWGGWTTISRPSSTARWRTSCGRPGRRT
jgi:carboxymethylenebutenolidase